MKFPFGMDRNLAIVHLNIILYAFCYWLTAPVLPYLLKSHGATTLSFGYFQSLFNIVQLGGGLVVGALQDRYSGPMALSITQIGSACVYAVLLSSTSIEGLYLSRLLTVIQQSMQVAQAIVSKAVPEEHRAIQLGRLSLSYSIGMIGGSLLSGKLSLWTSSNTAAISLAVVLAFAIVPVNFLFLDRVNIATGLEASEKDHVTAEKHQLSYLSLALQVKKVLLFLGCLFASRSIFEPVSNVLLIDKYQIQQSTMSQLMSAFAVVGVVTNVVILPVMLKWLGNEDRLVRLCIGVGVAGYAAIGILLPQTVELFLICAFGITFAASMLYTLSTSHISKHAPKSAHGQAIAMTHALRSAVGIVCPVIGSYLLSNGGQSVVAMTNAGLLALSMFLV